MLKWIQFIVLFGIGYFAYLPVSQATQKIATGGNWNASSAWGNAGAPADNDTLTIPESVTITVNCNCATVDNIQINVFGTLDFNNGRKINLSANSTVDIYSSGSLSGGNSGSKVNIGGNSVWSGGETLSGPVTCNNSSCGSNSTLPVSLINFEVMVESDFNEIWWATATERNSNYFILESSNDFQTWIDQCMVLAAGQSTELKEYEWIDYSKSTYYRLVQVDLDGQTEVFGPITAIREQEKSDRNVIVKTEPSAIKIYSSDGSLINFIEIYDVSGNRIYAHTEQDIERLIFLPDREMILIVRSQLEGQDPTSQKFYWYPQVN